MVRRNNRYANRYATIGAYGSLARYAYNNRNALRSSILNRFRSRSGMTMTNRKYATSGGGITSQYDRKLIYRKKRMPYKKKKAWKKFNRKVLAVNTKELGTSTVVRNDLVQLDFNLVPGEDTHQSRNIVALYPLKHTVKTYWDDLNQIAADTRLAPSSKIIFCSGVLDMTIRVQSILKQSPATGNPSLSAEIDIYEISMRNATGQSGEAADLENAFDLGHTNTANIPGLGSGLAQNSRGWTPFDCTEALSQYRIKVWKKTKYFLSAEQTLTYQVRDPKQHIFTKDQIPTASAANWPGVTRWIYIAWKPVPGYTYVAAPNNDTLRLNIGVTRKYMYKINQDSTDYDATV